MNEKVNAVEIVIEDLELARTTLRHCLEHDCWGNAKDVLAVIEQLRIVNKNLAYFYDKREEPDITKLEDVKMSYTEFEE